ncbi:hypothetical protein [Mesonia mobilis]|uniref:Uncharacterized protein n=1 Tax=Mesonia mobilis TaxID=369791 RepID=A0ABQ3BSS6_9FLAO|nr:hypothetical protein [Mesonia mobilis]MBQ0739108.1 hypothetical protein [Aquimarina celericrescens]GGZ56425.1 hypothetical protein GCM10008088_17500 [Mesonia mobilis]
MVTIVDYKSYQKEDGEKFFTLVVQGGVEAVKSKETGKTYLTARKTQVSSTFDELTCQQLKGSQLPGEVRKVQTDPYEYAIPDTGEIIELSHKYEYVDTTEEIYQDNVVDEDVVV